MNAPVYDLAEYRRRRGQEFREDIEDRIQTERLIALLGWCFVAAALVLLAALIYAFKS